MANMDPMTFLTTSDPLVRSVMGSVARRYHEMSLEVDRNRAALIANAIGKLFKG